MNLEALKRNAKYIIPLGLVAMALACPWLANAFRANQHDILVQDYLSKGCRVMNVLTMETSAVTNVSTMHSQNSNQVTRKANAGTRMIASGKQTLLECPPGLGQSGRTNWTVYSSCFALVSPEGILKQLAVSPSEPGRVLGCETGSINE